MDKQKVSEWLVIVGGIALAVGAVIVAKNYSLWVLVPIPGAVGLVYQLLNLSLRFESRKTVVTQYVAFTKAFDATWSGDPDTAAVSEDVADAESMDRHAPTFTSMLWGTLLLTAIFSLPAVISNGGTSLAAKTEWRHVSAALKTAEDSASAKDAKIDTVKTALNVTRDKLKAAEKGTGLEQWQLGLIFSGFGVWVLIVMRTIGRINAGGLNARFYITASLRAGAAMMLGFFFGASGILTKLTGETTYLEGTYFLVGLFYPLFFEMLRDEAYRITKRKKSITTEMPTTWVEGVDDDTQDILTEVNVLSVQHLASADPGVLTMRTLFPFNRVLDLIDQAILISYFGENILVLRKFHIRGALDFVALMEPIILDGPERAEAENGLSAIAEESKMSFDTLMSCFGMSIYNDYRVNLLMRLWQHNVQSSGYVVRPAVAAHAAVGAPVPEHLPIMQQGAASYRAFDVAYNSRLETELRREARERAAAYLEQNPDAADPADDFLKTSYEEAFPAAQKRAALGTNPKTSERTRTLYGKAFRGALA